MIEAIENWLTAGSYWEGVELYQAYGSSAMLKELFASSADSYNRKKLGAELTAILKAAIEARDQAAQVVEPDEIVELRQQTYALLDERAATKERARVLVEQGTLEGPELEALAMRLAFGIRDELDAIYGRIEFWKANGFLPETERAAVQSVAELVKRRNTLRTYVSRGGKAEKMAQWKGELAQVKILLQQLNG